MSSSLMRTCVRMDYAAPAAYERLIAPRYSPIAHAIMEAAGLRSGERVLELGAGTGLVTGLASERIGARGRLWATDLSPGMLASAHDRVCAANVSFAIVDYNAPLPFLDASFDAVLSGLTFDRSSALAEAARVLAPGGRVALAMWGPSYGEVRMMSRARRSLGQPPYPSAAPGRAVRRLERSGFSSVQRRDLRLAPRFASVEDNLTYRRGCGLPRGSTVAEHERLLEALCREALAATAADGSLTLDWKVTVLTADRPPTRTLRPGRLSARSQIRSLTTGHRSDMAGGPNMISEAVTHKSWRRFARRGGIALALATAVVAGTVVSVPIARAALSQPPAAVCANGAGLQPVLGCPPPAYVGDDNSEGECGGASGQPAFIDNSTTDPFHRLVRVKLDAGGYFPALTKGTNVNVLLPRDYASSARRYPVLYMFAGGSTNQDSWLSATDLLGFTNQFVGGRAAIVVLVASSDSGIDLDWRNGRWLWESVEVNRLIPYIDAHFRTIADRAHRAVAGDSAGGFTATHLAARHPDMFIAAASFSGFLDFTLDSPATEAAFFPIEREEDLCGGGQPGDAGLAGDPVMSDIWWHNLNPTDLASNLRGLTLFITSGNGIPCGSGDVTPQFNPYPWDTLTYPMSRAFSAALTRAGIPHIADFYGCGTHLWSYWQPELHRFWSMMLAAFGRKPPVSFDYRTADSAQHSVGLVHNSAYGWTFAPDPARAPEFLDARAVSKRGLTLVGSGQTTVTTAPLFAAGESVRVSGAGGPAKVAIANTAGQITFTVDLGPPHTAQEYTPQALAASEDRPGYFTTRTVTFTPAGSALGRGIERVASRCARLRDHRSYTRTGRSTGATTGSCRHRQRIGRRQR